MRGHAVQIWDFLQEVGTGKNTYAFHLRLACYSINMCIGGHNWSTFVESLYSKLPDVARWRNRAMQAVAKAKHNLIVKLWPRSMVKGSKTIIPSSLAKSIMGGSSIKYATQHDPTHNQGRL